MAEVPQYMTIGAVSIKIFYSRMPPSACVEVNCLS